MADRLRSGVLGASDVAGGASTSAIQTSRNGHTVVFAGGGSVARAARCGRPRRSETCVCCA
jgi:hypothetical protein